MTGDIEFYANIKAIIRGTV